MTLFDTHAHFTDAEEARASLERAFAAGFSGVMVVGLDYETNALAGELSLLYPGAVRAAMGLDISLASEMDDSRMINELSRLKSEISEWQSRGAAVAAIGETGLDYSHGESQKLRERQQKLFAGQVRLADELSLPLSVHSRGAEADTLEILKCCGSRKLMNAGRLGVIHCFTESAEFADKAAELGMYFGVSGIITFGNADALRQRVSKLPRNRILLETDSPYLAPVPLRGKKCEPAFAVHTMVKLAEILNLTAENAASLTTANAIALLG